MLKIIGGVFLIVSGSMGSHLPRTRRHSQLDPPEQLPQGTSSESSRAFDHVKLRADDR